MAEKNRISKDWDKIDREDDLLKEAQCDQMWKEHDEEHDEELATDEGVTTKRGVHNSEYSTRNRKTRRKQSSIKNSRHKALVKMAEKAIIKDEKDMRTSFEIFPKYRHHISLIGHRKKNTIINP